MVIDGWASRARYEDSDKCVPHYQRFGAGASKITTVSECMISITKQTAWARKLSIIPDDGSPDRILKVQIHLPGARFQTDLGPGRSPMLQVENRRPRAWLPRSDARSSASLAQAEAILLGSLEPEAGEPNGGERAGQPMNQDDGDPDELVWDHPPPRTPSVLDEQDDFHEAGDGHNSPRDGSPHDDSVVGAARYGHPEGGGPQAGNQGSTGHGVPLGEGGMIPSGSDAPMLPAVVGGPSQPDGHP